MNQRKNYLQVKINPYPTAWCYPGVTSTSPRSGNEFLVAPSDHQTIPEDVGGVSDPARAAVVWLCPPQGTTFQGEEEDGHLDTAGGGPGIPRNTPGIAGRGGRCWEGLNEQPNHAGINPTLPGPVPTAPEVFLLLGSPQGCSSLPPDPKSFQFSGPPPTPDILQQRSSPFSQLPPNLLEDYPDFSPS